MPNDTEEIADLMRIAFTQAFQAQIGQLYKVYMGNTPSVAEQRSYTKKGIEQAIEAYRLALSAVESWEG